MIIKKGVPASNGIAIGKVYLLDRNKVFISGYRISDISAEKYKLENAISDTKKVISELRKIESVNNINNELYDAYRLILEDEFFIGETKTIIESERVNAEYALKKVRDNFINTLSNSDNEYLRDRVHDFEHIYQRMQRFMSNQKYDDFESATSESIIVSHDLTSTDIDILNSKGIKGFVTDIGGVTSHNIIIAKAAEITAVVGAGNIYSIANHNDIMIVDGFKGDIIINPTDSTLNAYIKRASDYQTFIANLNINDNSCVTADNIEISLKANVENNKEISLVDYYGLQGVGLYRTEFLFLDQSKFAEEDQYNIFCEGVRLLNGKPLVLRSFDLGGEKMKDKMPHFTEDNPALGLRAIRYCLHFKDFFRIQLRAILRASAHGDISIMLPMVTSVDEVITIKEMMNKECKELLSKGIEHKSDIKLGIMVELPATALSLNVFSPHVDFFSVGTNDLIQYTLGIDRNNEFVMPLYSVLNHSILVLLSKVVDDASTYNKPLSICGEIASDAKYTAVILGLGFRTLSMNCPSSKVIRSVIRKLNIIDCKDLVVRLKSAPTVKEAELILHNFNKEKLADVLFV